MPLVWAAFLLPPMVWSGHLLIVYLFASSLCPTGGTALVRASIGAVTFVALAIIAACGLYGRWEANRLGTAIWEQESPPPRSRGFMVRAAVYASALYFIATLFEAAPAFALRGC